MLDIRFIRENVERVKQTVALKGGGVDVEALVALEDDEAVEGADVLRAERAEFSREHVFKPGQRLGDHVELGLFHGDVHWLSRMALT